MTDSANRVLIGDANQAETLAHLPVGDYAHTQFKLWCELIEGLLNAEVPLRKQAWRSPGHQTKVEGSLELLKQLRGKAVVVQKQLRHAHEFPDFFSEYLPALLYFTLREIGYPSRPPFKRLLAVYHASHILSHLQPAWLVGRSCAICQLVA